jgi:hypothetical protein
MGTFPLLTADQLDLTRDTYDFTQTTTDTLGNLGTPDDGFDSYVADTIALLSTVGTPGDSLLEDLNLAAGIGGSIDPLSLQADATSLPASMAEGDAILSDVGALNGGAGAAPPGGGSVGGGTIGAPPTQCSDVNFGTLTGFSQLVTRQITYTNNHPVAQTIKSVSIAPPAYVNILQVAPDLAGRVLQPGQSVQLIIGFTAIPGTYSGKITLNTDAADPQPCITVELVALNPVSSGGVQPPTGILGLTGGGQPPRTGRNG